MKGYVKDIYRVFDARELELVIPVYQRNYDWGAPHCSRLLQDLTGLVKAKRGKHFFGAIVCDPEGSFRLVVIDGQQRLTTVSILMLALSHLLDKHAIAAGEGCDASLSEKIRNSYLLGSEVNDQPKFKLKQVKDNAEAYRRLFGPESEFIESSNITANYRFFLKAIPETGLTAAQLWSAICHLEVMYLDLEEHDDPQRIFESLNSTGLELSEADKVRNLVLMGLESGDQERVYEDYWNKIENNVNFATDAFLRWYLVAKTGKTPKKSQVYEAFKLFAETKGALGEALLAEVRDYSNYYHDLLAASTGYVSVDWHLGRLNILKYDVVLPFLMPLLAEVRAGTVSERDFASSLEMIESFLFRRFVCGIPTNALDTRFGTLYREITKLRTDNQPFPDLMAYALTSRSGNIRFPTDEEFQESFSSRGFYKISRHQSQYLWECLENTTSKDVRDIATALDRGNLSIEHVMPQTLTEEWRTELGAEAERIHTQWLHRIGNLTVTGYNSSYSNQPFAIKKTVEHGFDDSPFRLNKLIKAANRWDEKELSDRTSALTAVALSYWKYPETTFTPPKVAHPTEPMGEDADFTNRRVIAFTFGEVTRPVKTWRHLLELVLRECANRDRSALFSYARSDKVWFRVDASAADIAKDWSEVVPGLQVLTHSSTQDKIRLLRRLFTQLRIDTDELTFRFRNETENDPSSGLDAGSGASQPPGEHHALTALIDDVDLLAELDAAPANCVETSAKLMEAIQAFPVPDLITVLGGPAATFSSDETKMRSASTDQLLALLNAKINENQLFNPMALHAAIIDGSISAWLSKIEENDRLAAGT